MCVCVRHHTLDHQPPPHAHDRHPTSAGSVFFSLIGIQGARLRRMEGMTQCGQCLLCTYQFGIAGIMVVELMLALILMLWATNQMEIVSDLQGGDTSEGSLAHTINYNLGNNFVNCSYEDCCPPVLINNGDTSFSEYKDAPAIQPRRPAGVLSLVIGFVPVASFGSAFASSAAAVSDKILGVSAA